MEIIGYDPEYEDIIRAWENRDANNPDEPFQAVAALWNGDLHAGDPYYAPRHHWVVVSPYKIEHRPIDEIIAEDPRLQTDDTP